MLCSFLFIILAFDLYFIMIHMPFCLPPWKITVLKNILQECSKIIAQIKFFFNECMLINIV